MFDNAIDILAAIVEREGRASPKASRLNYDQYVKLQAILNDLCSMADSVSK